MKDKLKMFTGEWKTGKPMRSAQSKLRSDLVRNYDPSESREIILDRKLRLDSVEKPDWIEIIPPRKPN